MLEKEIKTCHIMQLIDSYYWKILSKEIVDELPEFTKLEELKIKYIVDKLNEKLETSPTTFTISKNPEKFIPALALIFQATEEEAEVTVEQKEKPKLFSFTLKPSLKWKNISINNKALASNAGIKTLKNSYSEILEMFDQAFDFKRFGYKSIDDLRNAKSTGKALFACFVRLLCSLALFACFSQTDGHSISLQFVRKRRDRYSETPISALEDFSRTEVEENFLPRTIDPGRKHIYTASIGHDSKEHQVRRCSDLERRCYTDIETNTPTSKTMSLETYKKDEERYGSVANIKPTTPATDTKAAEPAAVDTKVVNPADRQKEKGDDKLEEKKNNLYLLQTYNMCKGEEKMKPLKLLNGIKVNGILECGEPCHLLWQRDVNATKNMLDIADTIREGQGRPNPLNGPIAVEKTVSL
ncbi:hypothetical protein HPULCUR_005976 [Helicostylum pulchrum]|uniref:Uncharacterized protein n=1 Tax=Helicostylum pulchrum TaxID=562976 RepID=A0ABP9Y0L1_9FUNG